MHSDTNIPFTANVDVKKVKFTRPQHLGIDFTNEIDIWSKMEFRYRELIKHDGKKIAIDGPDILKGPHSLFYSLRQCID